MSTTIINLVLSGAESNCDLDLAKPMNVESEKSLPLTSDFFFVKRK